MLNTFLTLNGFDSPSIIFISLALFLIFAAFSYFFHYVYKTRISVSSFILSSTLPSILVNALTKRLYLFVFVLGLYFSTHIFTFYFLQGYWVYFLKAFSLAFVFLILLVFVDFITLFANRWCELSAKTTEKKPVVCDRTLVSYSQSASKLIAFVVLLVALFHSFGITLKTIGSALGVLGFIGVAMVFAIRPVFDNFFSGWILLFNRPFVVGDFIKLNNVKGRVLKIGLLTTKVVTEDNIIHVLPNSKITSAEISNYKEITAPKGIRVEITLNVASDSNIDMVKKALLSAADKTDGVFINPPPEVRLTNVGGSSLDFSLFFWCLYKDEDVLKDKVYTNIISEFKKHKIVMK